MFQNKNETFVSVYINPASYQKRCNGSFSIRCTAHKGGMTFSSFLSNSIIYDIL
jgi:hypothetical protein